MLAIQICQREAIKYIPRWKRWKFSSSYGKTKNQMQRLLRPRIRMNLSVKFWKRKIRASFAVTPQTAEVTVTMHLKCIVKMETALNVLIGMLYIGKNIVCMPETIHGNICPRPVGGDCWVFQGRRASSCALPSHPYSPRSLQNRTTHGDVAWAVVIHH